MKSTEKELIKQINTSFLNINNQKIRTVFLAYSGGPDSTALLYALKKWTEENPVRLQAVYIDHGIRSKSDILKEEELVRFNAEKCGIPLIIKHTPDAFLENFSRKQKISLEDAARIYRYKKLKRVAGKEKPFSVIATAHTRDDQAETLLMKFLQGASAAGLQGIREFENDIWRPLLNCEKESILRYLKDIGAPCSNDMTNDDTTFFRNRVRSELIPVIRRIYPGFFTAMNSMTEKNRDWVLFMEKAVKENEWEMTEKGILRINLYEFISFPEALRFHSFYAAYDRLMTGRVKQSYRLPFRFLQSLSGDISIHRNPLLCGHGIKLEIEGDYLYLKRADKECPEEKCFFEELSPEKNCCLSDKMFLMTETLRDDKQSAASFLKKDIEWPLILRSRREGDRILVDGRKRDIKKILNDWSLPRNTRTEIPLLCDRRGILAVLGSVSGKRNIFSDYINFPINDDFFRIFLYIDNN